MTTTDILQIPQVPTFDPGNLQNDLHIGFGTDLTKRFTEARWTDDDRTVKAFPDAVDQAVEAFISSFTAEDDAYVISQKSNYVKQRNEKDAARDTLFKEIRKTVDTFATLSIFPEKQTAALTMQPVMKKYKIDPDGGIEAQTVATGQWLQEHLRSTQQQLAAKELGIADGIQQLKTLNDEVLQLTQDRNDEAAQRALAALRTARTATDQAYRALMLLLNAMALTQPGTELYTDLVKSIQQTIKYYRQLAEQRRKKNAAARDKKKGDSGGNADDSGSGDDSGDGSGDSDSGSGDGSGDSDGGGSDSGGSDGGGSDSGGSDDKGGSGGGGGAPEDDDNDD